MSVCYYQFFIAISYQSDSQNTIDALLLLFQIKVSIHFIGRYLLKKIIATIKWCQKYWLYNHKSCILILAFSTNDRKVNISNGFIYKTFTVHLAAIIRNGEPMKNKLRWKFKQNFPPCSRRNNKYNSEFK